VLCEPCSTAWQTYQQPFAPVSTGSPNPAAAAVLGLIPGVGAMYNGQFFKGLIHVVIFAVLVSLAHVSGIFGIFIPAWILYQSFEAFHTAKALRDGLPVPDPLGLNDIGNWLNLGKHPQYPGQPPVGQSGAQAGPQPGAGPAQPNPNPWTAGATQPPPASGAWQAPYAGGAYQQPYQPPYQAQWENPYAPPAPGPVPPGQFDPNAPPQPPIPPDPSAYGGGPAFWHRGAPVGAVVLIALGTLFLLGQLDIFHGRLIEFTWPVFLIGLGVWLVIRRLGESQGGPK
jgi:TM2 domain-containing membrane protein YozV